MDSSAIERGPMRYQDRGRGSSLEVDLLKVKTGGVNEERSEEGVFKYN